MPSSLNNLAVFNSLLVPANDPAINSIKSELVIYEVIRVIEGKCLFLEDHLTRLFNSVGLAKRKLDSSWQDLSNDIYKLIFSNSLLQGNIRLDICFQYDHFQVLIQVIPHHYPSAEDYSFGVKAISYKAERDNPNAKVLNPELREKINIQLKMVEAYEAVLVNQEGYVTEGSRSNLFFIKNDRLITAPSASVLVGITRDQVFKLCSGKAILIEERNISFSGISQFDSAFITGTSPKILPLNAIDEFLFDPANKLMQDLIIAYNEKINQYIKNPQ